jgi:hypothetical protein
MTSGRGRPRIVAHTVSAPPWRRIGAELATLRLLGSLQAEGWGVTCVAHSVVTCEQVDVGIGEPVWVVPSMLAAGAPADVVLAHIPFTAAAQRHAERSGARLVMAAHGGPPGWLAAAASRLAPDLLLANSETMRVSLERTGLPVHVLHPPVFGEAHVLPDVPTGAGYVTLVNAAKGGAVLFDLARRLPAVRFLLVDGGYGDDETVDRIVEGLEALPNVARRGQTEDMRSVWADTRVLLMPSLEESWGMVAVEAMAAGVPVIGSRAPGLTECLGGAMPQVDALDVDGWEDVLMGVLSHDESYAHLHVAALRRAAQLDPAPGLRATHRRLAALIGREVPMGTLRFYNVSTGQIVDAEEGTSTAARLLSKPLHWQRIDEGAAPSVVEPIAYTGPAEGAPPVGGGPDADPALQVPPAVERPADSAAKAAWVDYAVSRGAERVAATKAPKAALIALYGEG